nr:thiolase family protein [Desulfobacterales bacterium]
MRERIAIVGVGQTYHKSKRPDVNDVEMINEAVNAALNDAQLHPKDIDAVVMGNIDFFEGRYLSDMWTVDGIGSYLKAGFKVHTGGTTGGTVANCGFFVAASGLFDVVLAVGYQKQDACDSRAALMTWSDPVWDRHIHKGAIGLHARRAALYMRASGAQEIHGAMVRVKEDKGACLNPYAHLKLNLTIEDVLNSPPLVYPLRRVHMCPTSCGACALVIATEKKAKKISRKPVWVKDWTEAHLEKAPVPGIGSPEEEVSINALETAATKLYRRNGITNPRKEIHLIEMYGPTSWSELQWLPELHICDLKDSWKLIEKGVTEIDGELPVNPSGGVVATNPIGASGTLRVAEAALQIRGDAGGHQVTREVDRALATAYGAGGWNVVVLLEKNL